MKPNQIQAIAAAMEAGAMAVEMLLLSTEKKRKATTTTTTVDYCRKQQRSTRRKFRHAEALHCIKRDYLGSTRGGDLISPLLGAEFQMIFKISRSRFQVLMEDIKASGCRFYQPKTNLHADDQCSLEAKLLLPIKTLACGVPCHTFIDYFQMSRQYARECCLQFDIVMKQLYAKEYLRFPTADDLQSIIKLHKNVHKVDGLFGCIDCTHIPWKNCPKAWADSRTDTTSSSPSILLEAIVDHNMFFWDMSFGYTGNEGPLSVLTDSSVLQKMADGTFHDLEQQANVLPFTIKDQQFTKGFMLADNMYPKCSRFAMPVDDPTTDKELKYTEWQQSSKKDVDRAFGVLKRNWQFLDNPILLFNLSDISLRITCCIILHNMLTSDKVMGDPRAKYTPSASIAHCPGSIFPGNGNNDNVDTNSSILGGLGKTPAHLLDQVTTSRKDTFNELMDEQQDDDHQRLHQALMDKFGV
ncbi:plant transposon protein [Nitzschia inconspicua]|uniref:Plant transposon protein n=1 Tax=Nitzschia inconspicua TaxID=303405 RepID=A0A9K3K451_9STRA|nr:plant transposon protein [Nitzschia inconspicua]KAG7361941.1 plant transposon protein [Nitzschia inconspicua]